MGVTQWVTPIFILVNLCIITDFFRFLSYICTIFGTSLNLRRGVPCFLLWVLVLS